MKAIINDKRITVLKCANGKIAAVGNVEGIAGKEIDAGGKLLTPGWVDVHSHMDGQSAERQ